MSSITASVFFPIFPWIFELAIIALGVGVGLCLASVGELSYKIIGMNSTTCVCSGIASNYTNNGACNPKIFVENCVDPATRLACQVAVCNFKGIDNPNIIQYFHVRFK